MQLLANIDVDDVAKATDLYCNALGLKVGRRCGADMVELRGASATHQLLRKDAGPAATADSQRRRGYARHWTPVPLDFIVPEIHAAVERAAAAGARLEGEVRTASWGRIAALADPFGHGFCL